MRTYYLLVHPVYGQKIQKAGFSFWGFFFPYIWTLFKKLYLIFFVMISMTIFLMIYERSVNNKIINFQNEIYNAQIYDLMGNERYNSAYRRIYKSNSDLSGEDIDFEVRSSMVSDRMISYVLSILFAGTPLFIIHIIVALKGNNFVINNLLKRGYRVEKKILAHNKDDFLAKIHTKSVDNGSIIKKVSVNKEEYDEGDDFYEEEFGGLIKKLNMLGYTIGRENGKRIIEHPNGTGKIFCYSRKEYEDRINSILEFHEKHGA